ncbi:VOC family protein [Saccharopolyspora cebuensis]|uniref:VOC family protein n=1 Tax=Saccharopolyspora cebuensis TaxID=418759 RepID=A0ABV4CTZ0_9PSEU
MGRLVHFEVTSDDPRSTAAFFEAAFGWAAEDSPFCDDYFTLSAADGSMVGAAMSAEYQNQRVIAWLSVDDLEKVMDSVVAAGGKAGGPINEIPGRGRVTYVADPQGTVFGLLEVR